MKKKYIIPGAIALTVLATAAGLTSSVLASSNNNGMLGKFKFGQEQNLTEAQKTEMKAKIDAVQAALKAGNYDAWVSAEKAVNANSPMLTKVTAANFQTYVDAFNKREATMTAQKAKIDAVKAAITANDYNAWVTAEKAVNANSPLLTKITAANFSQFVQAHNLRDQANSILQKLGIGNQGLGMRGEGLGMGEGMGRGGHGGMGEGMRGGMGMFGGATK